MAARILYLTNKSLKIRRLVSKSPDLNSKLLDHKFQSNAEKFIVQSSLSNLHTA